MIVYKIDVIKELNKKGIKVSDVRENGIFGQDTLRKFRECDTNITVKILNRLCCVLDMQPYEILRYVETDEDKNNFLSLTTPFSLNDKNT